MNAEADKITAELMALAERFAYHSALIDETHIETRDALEQAIRRAVDWGEPVAFSAEPDLRIDGLEAEMFLVSRAKEADYPVPLYARSQA